MRVKQYKLLFVFLVMRLFVVGQTTGYHYRANLNEIDSSGFYNVVLTPEINAYLKIGCHDFRIVNDSGKWVPHVLRIPNSEFINHAVDWTLNIITKKSNKSSSDFVIKTFDTVTSNLILEIRNTDAKRYCNLTGSDDQVNWFIINDSIVISPIKNDFDNNSRFKIEFPPVNYKYIRIHITNEGKEPFDILKLYNNKAIPETLLAKGRVDHPPLENPKSIISQKDSGKNSYINVIQTDSFQFNEIRLKVSGAKYYLRNANLYTFSAVGNNFSNLGQLVSSFEISNNSTLKFRLPVTKAKMFCIVIHNEDNPALKVEDVKTYIGYRVATAWLEKGKHYSILLNKPDANTPNYDLQLRDLFPIKEFPVAGTGAITSIQQSIISTSPIKSNKWMIWLLIIIAVLVLGFFTYKLITDMNKSKS